MSGNGFHLRERTRFIRFYYEEAAKPFAAIKTAIEDGLPPFDNSPYSEDSEPAYLSEWQNANNGQSIVGQSCVALLADSLKLYLNDLMAQEIGLEFTKDEKRDLKARGYIPVFVDILKEIIGEDNAGIDFGIIEQVVLVRNRSQHGTEIYTFTLRHDPNTLKKYPKPFFADEEDYIIWLDQGSTTDSWFTPDVEITREKLFQAVDQIDALSNWVDEHEDKIFKWRREHRAQR